MVCIQHVLYKPAQYNCPSLSCHSEIDNFAKDMSILPEVVQFTISTRQYGLIRLRYAPRPTE